MMRDDPQTGAADGTDGEPFAAGVRTELGATDHLAAPQELRSAPNTPEKDNNIPHESPSRWLNAESFDSFSKNISTRGSPAKFHNDGNAKAPPTCRTQP